MRCRRTLFLTMHSERRAGDRTSTSLASISVVQSMPPDSAKVDRLYGAEKTRLLSSSHTRAFGIIFQLPEIEPYSHLMPGREYSATRESVARLRAVRQAHKP